MAAKPYPVSIGIDNFAALPILTAGADAPWRTNMDPAMTTTAFTIDGFRVTRALGIVRGITVRSRSVIGNFGAALQTIVGGNISIYTELCEKARQEAFDLMLTHAAERGANAVIGVRYDANEVTDGVTEVLCYGTAVVIERG
jgi:uncharacterized protein YbjQ (UPF0145 family)